MPDNREDFVAAVKLFDEDRQRFLTLLREFLANPRVPDDVKAETIQSTLVAVRGIGALRPTDE